MKPLRLLSALFAVSLSTACGEGGQPGPADGGIRDYEAYFGLQQGRCFEYSLGEAKEAFPALGVAVEQLDETSFAVPTHVLSYRTSSLAMKDWVSIDGNRLKLHKRYFPGGKELLYRPAVTLLEAPPRGNSKLESTSEVAIYEGGELLSNGQHTLRVDLFEPRAEPLPFGVTVTGHAVNFDEEPSTGRSELRFFVPGTEERSAPAGWVKISFNFSLDEAASARGYSLQGVRELTEGGARCGSAP